VVPCICDLFTPAIFFETCSVSLFPISCFSYLFLLPHRHPSICPTISPMFPPSYLYPPWRRPLCPFGPPNFSVPLTLAGRLFHVHMCSPLLIVPSPHKFFLRPVFDCRVCPPPPPLPQTPLGVFGRSSPPPPPLFHRGRPTFPPPGGYQFAPTPPLFMRTCVRRRIGRTKAKGCKPTAIVFVFLLRPSGVPRLAENPPLLWIFYSPPCLGARVFFVFLVQTFSVNNGCVPMLPF